MIDGEEADGGAVFGRHVADGGAIGQGQRGDAGSVELDELADHAFLAQHLRDGEHQVGGGAAFGQTALQLEADHFGQQHRDGLAEHARFGFDAADAPADHAQAVDHGGVRIGADQRIGIGEHGRLLAIGEDHRRQIFEIHLVHDAGVGRHHAKILKRFLAPAQERVALLIALEFEQRVDAECAGGAELIHLHGVIDHQIGGDQRIGALGIGAHVAQRVAHGGQIDHAGNAGEILQQDARRAEVDFLALARRFSRRRRTRCPDAFTVAPFSVRSRFSSRILME